MNSPLSIDLLAARAISRGWGVGLAESPESRLWCKQQLRAEHTLGAGRPAGHQLWQVVFEPQSQQPVAIVLWAASALHLKERDGWIGWDTRMRASRLSLIVNNTRLLILEAAREPNLASRALGAALRCLCGQWYQCHGYEPILAEAFTDIETHCGTTYKVTNWTPLGLTQGHSRQRADFYIDNQRPKKLWVKPLRHSPQEARALLCATRLPAELRVAEIAPAYATCPLSADALRSLREVFQQVSDPRRASHTYHVSSVLTLVCIGLLCGAESFNAILRHAQSLSQPLRAKIGLPKKKGTHFYKVPTYNAMINLLRAIDLEESARLLAAWQRQHQGLLPRHLALDGKDLGAQMGIVVSLVLSGGREAGTPVSMRTADKGRELPTAQAMLADESLSLEDSVITADALHCQQDTARIVAGKGGDYLLSLKDNQPAVAAEARRRLEGSAPLFRPDRRKATAGSTRAG